MIWEGELYQQLLTTSPRCALTRIQYGTHLYPRIDALYSKCNTFLLYKMIKCDRCIMQLNASVRQMSADLMAYCVAITSSSLPPTLAAHAFILVSAALRNSARSASSRAFSFFQSSLI